MEQSAETLTTLTAHLTQLAIQLLIVAGMIIVATTICKIVYKMLMDPYSSIYVGNSSASCNASSETIAAEPKYEELEVRLTDVATPLEREYMSDEQYAQSLGVTMSSEPSVTSEELHEEYLPYAETIVRYIGKNIAQAKMYDANKVRTMLIFNRTKSALEVESKGGTPAVIRDLGILFEVSKDGEHVYDKPTLSEREAARKLVDNVMSLLMRFGYKVTLEKQEAGMSNDIKTAIVVCW